MKKKTTLQFTVNKEDVRKVAAGAVDNILNRFKAEYVVGVQKVAESLTFEKGKDILKDINVLLGGCQKMAEELDDIIPLIDDIKDTVDRPEPAVTPSVQLPPQA